MAPTLFGHLWTLLSRPETYIEKERRLKQAFLSAAAAADDDNNSSSSDEENDDGGDGSAADEDGDDFMKVIHKAPKSTCVALFLIL